MNKIIFLFIFIFFTIFKIQACDICSCGSGNNFIGILPDFNKQILGIRYRYNTFLTHIGVGDVKTYLTTTENYSTTEIWGGIYIAKKIKLIISIPYNYIYKFNETANFSKNGLGDCNTIVYLNLFRSRKKIMNSMTIGSGIKFPTGIYNFSNETTNSNNLFQLGSGSIDFLLNAIYDISYKNVGLNINTNYKINTINKDQYIYGNKCTISSQLYYKMNIKNNLICTPNIGFLFENAGSDVDKNRIVEISGGNISLLIWGLEANYKNIVLGVNFQNPIYQNIASGIIRSNNRSALHVSFMF